jgi:NADP-dependent 3-hydroxy acid dehydrogenase YdfG
MNKVILVTGASSGIGKAIALDFAKHGYQIVLVARRKEKLIEVQKEIFKLGSEAIYFVLDVSDVNAVKKCINEVLQKFGRIDVLLNNAGIFGGGTSTAEDKDIEQVIDVNLKGAIYFAKYTAEQMKKQKSGYIFNVSSAAGKRALCFTGIYSASKFGLVGFNDGLYKDLMPYGIKVTAICPSFVATDMASEIESFDPSEIIQTDDIQKTIHYLLGLGKAAAVKEIMIECSMVITKETERMMKKYTK